MSNRSDLENKEVELAALRVHIAELQRQISTLHKQIVEWELWKESHPYPPPTLRAVFRRWAKGILIRLNRVLP